MSVNPIGMSLTAWADATILTLPDAWPIGSLIDEARWQDWAVSLVRSYALQVLPDPYEFDDWREWAERAYPLLEG